MKILVVRFSSIGDIVLTTPVPRCLKKQLGATVHYLTKEVYQPLLVHNPYIDQVFTIKKEITEVLSLLKKEKYDLIVDLHHNLRTFRLKLQLGIKSTAFPKLNVEKWLLTNFKINRLPDLHIVERYLKTVEHLGVHYDGKGLDYFISANDEQTVDSLIKQTPYYVVFAIGGKFATKRLPISKIIAICQDLPYPVLLIGGPEDQISGKKIENAVGNRVQNTCGQLSLGASAALIKQAACLVTHDTGMMHIGAALNKRIVSIWGNTVPDFGMTPFLEAGKGAHRLFQVKDLNCRPCSKIGYNACPKQHFKCMETQKVAEISTAIKELCIKEDEQF